MDHKLDTEWQQEWTDRSWSWFAVATCFVFERRSCWRVMHAARLSTHAYSLVSSARIECVLTSAWRQTMRGGVDRGWLTGVDRVSAPNRSCRFDDRAFDCVVAWQPLHARYSDGLSLEVVDVLNFDARYRKLTLRTWKLQLLATVSACSFSVPFFLFSNFWFIDKNTRKHRLIQPKGDRSECRAVGLSCTRKHTCGFARFKDRKG